MATLADVAREANCSPNLVAYVLKKETPPTKEKHKQILEIAKRLNYTPNRTAAALATGRTYNVTLLIGDSLYGNLHEPFFIEMLFSLLKGFSSKGIGVVLYSFTGEDVDEVKNVVLNNSSDGLLWYMGRIPEEIKRVILEKNFPTLLLLNLDKDLDYITADDTISVKNMLQYLLDNGHDRILYGGGGESSRYRAYEAFVEGQGLSYKERLPLTRFDYKNQEMLESYIRKNGLDFTAVFCENDAVAISVLHVLQNVGIRVPEEVSVVGYDDLPEAALCRPALTTVRQNEHQLAEEAVEVMLNKIAKKDGGASVRQILVQQLVLRDSVANRRTEER